MKYRTELLASGRNTTGLEVPPEIVEALGAGRKPPVTVTLNDAHTYRTTVASREGRFMLSVSADVRERAGIAAGEEIEVGITLDTDPREVTVPDDLTAALTADAAATAFWDTLPYSSRQRYVLQVDAAKTDDTRHRRIAKMIDDLRAGRK